MRIYLDNAATSHPKPPAVAAAMAAYAERIGASPGRGGYRESLEAGAILQATRAAIADLLGAGRDPTRVVFTLNCSDALNLAIKGVVRPVLRQGEPVRVLTSVLDHNSIVRPLRALERDGVRTELLPVDAAGRLDPDAVRAALADDVRLVALHHASNVSGVVQPVAAIAGICRAAGVPLLVDAAQTLGHLDLDAEALGLDLVAFPGHKGLLGPLGTGGLWIRPGLERLVEPLREGGTGSSSELDVQPETMPERYEPGSPNAIGVAGLREGVRWIARETPAAIRAHEQALAARLAAGLAELPGVRVLGPGADAERVGVVAISADGVDPSELAMILEASAGVLARAGLHCAPGAHRHYGTLDRGGAVRYSVGPFTTVEEIDAAVAATRGALALV